MDNIFYFWKNSSHIIVSRKYLFIYLVLTALIFNGCHRNIELPETIEAHYVKYKVEYLEEKAGDIPTRILPAHMDTYYTRYFIFTRIEGFFNQFSLTQIADLRHKKVTTLLNFFGNKVYYAGTNGELPAGITMPDQLDCRFTGEISVIGGLTSERIEVNTGEEQFSIYCTRDFSVRRPNITTPYQSIDHPLSDFRIELSVLKMHLTCAEFDTRTIESAIFTIPEDYRPVSRKAMEEIINSLFTKE